MIKISLNASTLKVLFANMGKIHDSGKNSNTKPKNTYYFSSALQST